MAALTLVIVELLLVAQLSSLSSTVLAAANETILVAISPAIFHDDKLEWLNWLGFAITIVDLAAYRIFSQRKLYLPLPFGPSGGEPVQRNNGQDHAQLQGPSWFLLVAAAAVPLGPQSCTRCPPPLVIYVGAPSFRIMGGFARTAPPSGGQYPNQTVTTSTTGDQYLSLASVEKAAGLGAWTWPQTTATGEDTAARKGQIFPSQVKFLLPNKI